MRIRRLDIVGFKSFMDRTVLVFDDGVTGVVGPNGCGKSNVADAIRWVLGEQSARQLRGRSMEDVIFNGSESKAPLSLAEVSLTFENDRPGELPAAYQGFGEITVGRRLHRTGESEYLVNGVLARLLDVNDIFFGSGVGRTAYSIVEQGRIGQIVSSRPEDRRSIIEEAAGISKYKRRREAAERRMEATEQNLLRVADIVEELSRQLDSLNRQARKAERFKALRAQIRELELKAAAARYLELTATRRAAEERQAAFRTEEAPLLARLTELEGALEADQAATKESEARVEELLSKEHELQSTVRVSEVSLEAAGRELSQIAERTMAQAAEAEALKERAEALAAEREAFFSQREELSSLVVSDEGRLCEAESSLKEAGREQGALAAEADRLRAAGAAARAEAAAHKNQLLQIDRQRTDLAARRDKGRGEADDQRRRATQLDKARASHLERLARTRQLMLRLDEQRGAQEELLERTRAEFIENEAKLITLREELAEKRSRFQSLVEIVRNYEGYGRGVKSLMTRGDPTEVRDRGIFGLVADVVSAPAEYETAVEALLGERLQYVIVESHAQGVEAIDYLKSAAEGRASLIPMSRLRDLRGDSRGPSASAPPPPDHPGVLCPCLTVVRYDPAYEKVVRFLLADALLVRDLPSALEIWQQAALTAGPDGAPVPEAAHTLVTLDGEVLDRHGVVTGGPLTGEGHGALQRRREVQELEETVRVFEAEFQLASERHRTLQGRLVQLETALKSLDRDGREKELSLLEDEKDLTRVGEELLGVRSRIGELEGDLSELEEALLALAREEEEHRLAAAAAEAEQSRAEERAKESLEWLEAWKARGDVLTAELTNIKVKAAADAERREGISAAIGRTEDARREVEERRARLFASLSENNARAAELRGRLDGTRVDISRVTVELGRVGAELSQARAAHEALASSARARDAESRALRGRAESLREAIGEASLTGREQALELAHLEEQTRERCQVELRFEVARFHLMPPPSEEERTRLEELRAQAERMGPINLTAIEEYDELARRHRFMGEQKADLERSLLDLKSAIVKINRASRERFQETFDRVNEKFQAVFPRLFSGGRAGLVLTSAPGDAEEGVEIFAQPPGKKLQSVNLLSGGEKALTAVSLLFAIFLVRPTPFCLLDEVDAPLDDANVGRYNEVVREMARGSQFILITHNKRTMEMVDTLYGVTMEEPGVSKLVSVRLSERTRESAAA